MNALDRVIGWFSPSRAIERISARATLQDISRVTGTGKGPYSAANQNRLNLIRSVVTKENEVPATRLEFLRSQSWDLYRDNPSCRKIVRSLEAKVIGPGMNPESLAVEVDGSPHVEFRARAKQLWDSLKSGFDSRGLPGKGGLTMAGQQKMALRATILSGDTLYRIKPINAREQMKRDIPIANTLQLIDTCRLAELSEVPGNELANGHTVFRGVELDADNLRVAYWVKSLPLDASTATPATVTRIPVEKMGHLYLEEDIDQLRGVPWFSSAILRAKRTEDLEYNVLVASAMAACVVGTYSKPTGATRFGLNAGSETSSTSADGSDLTDTDGNTITKIQPGMIANVGKDGKFDLMSPNQPNMNPEAFVQHLQRGTATALPGIKASTVTGDYRNSSFSSERSADNDTWPELKDVQEWFASSYCQPVWETILRSAMQEGYFDGVVSFEEFQASPGRFSAATWQGPVALSINPKDDAAAASARISGGLSSLQMECAKININWRDVLNDIAELYSVAETKGIPPEVINNIMGVDAQDQIAVMQAEATAKDDDVDDDDDIDDLDEAPATQGATDAE
jgi:lambda family phage portal protein